jgi:hypothetical protein
MSEFVECQNCGRRFWAENLQCPYCGQGGDGEGDDDRDRDAATDSLVGDLMRLVAPSTPVTAPRPARPSGGGLFDVLFLGFAVLAAATAAWAVAGVVRAPDAGLRAWFAWEAIFAASTALGVVGRRRWGRAAAIAFIIWHVVLGLASLFAAGVRTYAMLGSGPIALLLFAWPFASRQARDRFRR